ncbi:MAG: acetyl-CoA synthetase [Desulfobacteraceae bacterium 4572_89]|nr:MAG: acetyl-CoA synthetase [Desulfobacteraceae bacterium 4572_89]
MLSESELRKLELRKSKTGRLKINKPVLKKSQRKIIENSRPLGRVLEPDAKKILSDQGFDIPGFVLTDSLETARNFLNKSAGPVVAKAVSKKILHKTEFQAVVTGIMEAKTLEKQMERLKILDGCENILVEEMVSGLEIIIGAKNDFQFGPVVVLGIGGTLVELYNDTAIRMAPLKFADVYSMVDSLKAGQVFTGYRGKSGVNMEVLADLIVKFSHFIMDLESDFESIDLNPVICTQDKCVIADARIMLKKQEL